MAKLFGLSGGNGAVEGKMLEMDGTVRQTKETGQQLLAFQILLGYKRCFKDLPGASVWDVLGKQEAHVLQALCAALELTGTGCSKFALPAEGGAWTPVTA